MEISLISPKGTPAILFNDLCGSTTEFKLGFDDEAPSAITCPPSAGVVQRPLNPLSIFDGEEIKGDWKLRFRIKQTGFGSGGRIVKWQLESCGDLVLNAPYLTKNDTFFLPPATRSQIWVETLLAEDVDNSYDEIIYQLVSLPSHGTLYKGTTPLKAGDTFTQQEIEGFAISYEHDGSAARADQFSFILRDTDGAWLGTPQFNIVISEDATVNTENELQIEQLHLYPNPTKDEVTIESTTNVVQVWVYDVQGRLMQQFNNRLPISTIDVRNWAKGIYWIQVQTEKAILTKKLVVQ
ncbi:MAG: T9SS type A sorting domain-containing protein [Saprospiraceae bacterium]|nr:T9SS type A sorting domain-containing protein [Saprospiraceae bacterium]